MRSRFVIQAISLRNIGRLGHQEAVNVFYTKRCEMDGASSLATPWGNELYAEIPSRNLEKIPRISTCIYKHMLSLEVNNVKYVQ